MGKKKASKKGLRWILQKCYKIVAGANHRFFGTETQEDGTVREFILLNMPYTAIRRHFKGAAHPFALEYAEYFEKRTSDKWRHNSKRVNLAIQIAVTQKDLCPCCK